MIEPMEYNKLGYDYLQRVDAGLLHPGVDLNYGNGWDDLGLPIKAMTDGRVVFAGANQGGWGNLVVIHHELHNTWTRYGHLDTMLVSVGMDVKEGQQIGTCGATGGDWSPHLHFEVIIKKLSYWTQYTRNWSVAKIKTYFTDPLKYIEGHQSQPIVEWHKHNKIIEKWSNPPTAEEIKLGWTIYKAVNAIVKKEIDLTTLNLI